MDFEETLTYELYQEWIRFAERSGGIPNPNAFCTQVLPRQGYNIAPSTFRYHVTQLKIHGLLIVERLTGTIILPELEIRRKRHALPEFSS